jgi:hypothetical protein
MPHPPRPRRVHFRVALAAVWPRCGPRHALVALAAAALAASTLIQ